MVPFHPIGSGILAAPFVFFGNIIQKIQNTDGLISFIYYMYSIAPIFYLLLSILLIQKSLKSLNISFNNNLLLLAIFGTGVSYYSFDRFSMSHVYEFFATTFLIYLTTQSIKKREQFYKEIYSFFNWVTYIYFFSNKVDKLLIFSNPYGCLHNI